MTVVVDTNIVAYYLLRTEPFVDEVRRLWRAVTDPLAPSSWQAELTNVLWLAIRAGVIDVQQGVERLRMAKALGIKSVPIDAL